jgi:hypothetical protein
MWIWIVMAIFAYWLYKRPGGIARLANDTLKFEVFKELRARGKERESKEIPSIEDMEERFTRRLVASSVSLFAIFLWISWGIGTPWSVLIGMLPAALYATITWKLTKHYREIVLPLYLTLCRMPGARWNPRGKPTKWLRVSKDPGKPIYVRLPKDWHAGAMQVKMVEEIVKQRVPGEWKMTVNRPKFIMVFTPTAAIAVSVGEEMSRAPANVSLDKEEEGAEPIGKSPW